MKNFDGDSDGSDEDHTAFGEPPAEFKFQKQNTQRRLDLSTIRQWELEAEEKEH